LSFVALWASHLMTSKQIRQEEVHLIKCLRESFRSQGRERKVVPRRGAIVDLLDGLLLVAHCSRIAEKMVGQWWGVDCIADCIHDACRV